MTGRRKSVATLTPAGEHYAPYVDAAERRIIKEVLDRGRAILASHV
jgi:hypothetical protein